MIRLDDYQRSSSELAEFITSTWRKSYEGKMTFPLWSAEYFEWQLRWKNPHFRRNLIAIYDDSRLVATLLGSEYSFRCGNEILPGSIWSWMTIDPAYRGQGFAKLLNEERIRRLKDRHIDLVVSYRYFGSKNSLAERPHRNSGDNTAKFHNKVGFWVRVLNPQGVWDWSLSSAAAWGARLTSPWAPLPKLGKEENYIRKATPDDIPQCLELIHEKTNSLPLAIHWDQETLSNQLLGSPLSTTLVYEREEKIEGFINFHLLTSFSKCEGQMGLLDVMSTQRLSSRKSLYLMYAAMQEMLNQGAIVALKLRSGDEDLLLMLRSYFAPRAPESHLVMQWIGEEREVPKNAKTHLLWR
ncbi:hypothetical protein Pan54_06050 [Rubinisphaera italica]|uniref:N-acetyltransferase domain-containing protein n=2 Tax=Rubinisphaera italica TaxID=2527969 RepID=A0A5C5XAQ7_9PLAN|nr:hypothetical protein Pan54_06050 [Rubinisphaera italica]